MPKQKYRIISDGTPAGTKVFLPSGEQLKQIGAVHIEMVSGHCIAHIDLIALNPIIDLVTEGDIRNRVDTSSGVIDDLKNIRQAAAAGARSALELNRGIKDA